MNWAGCLGVGPGGRLLIAHRPRPGILDFAQDLHVAAIARSQPVPVIDRRPRIKRTRVESAALKARVIRALQRNVDHMRLNAEDNGQRVVESHTQIANREGIHTSYVDYIAQCARLTAVRRTTNEVLAIVAKARRLMAHDHPERHNQQQAAKACGVSPQYLCMLLARYA